MSKGEFNKESAIKSILKDLKKGIDKKNILKKIETKCNVSSVTIWRWYSEAENEFNKFRAKVEPLIIEKTAKAEIESILPTNEKMLAHLATLAMTAEQEKDQISATVNYLKARGGFAPIVNTNINIDAGKLTDQEIKLINNNLDKSY